MTAARILIADDSKTIRTQVVQILSEAGYDLATARDGKEALEQARTNPPALMVLDINMPLLDGFAVCLELRKCGIPWSGIPVVFLTSAESHALEILGEEMGAYLRKPVNRNELLRVVRSFVPALSEV